MRLLLTGAAGFTGKHLRQQALALGYEVFAVEGDIQSYEHVCDQVLRIEPTHVIHLAGISHVTGADELAYYKVNLLGALNLLKGLSKLLVPPQKVILASTSNIYGNNPNSPISEQALAAPVSHYGMSKLAMEYLCRPFLEQFPVVIARPFNYTGVGHDSRFVIPKIVGCFQAKMSVLELGNVEVLREYNDVRDICDIYLSLLKLGKSGQTYNLASGRTHSLREVISLLEEISGYDIEVIENPQFMRSNEIFQLTGDATRLQECIGPVSWRSLKDTLQWMYAAKQ